MQTASVTRRQPPGRHHLEKRGAGINVSDDDVLRGSRDRGRRGRSRASLVEFQCWTLGVQCDMVFNVRELDSKAINRGWIRDRGRCGQCCGGCRRHAVGWEVDQTLAIVRLRNADSGGDVLWCRWCRQQHVGGGGVIAGGLGIGVSGVVVARYEAR